MSGEPSLYADTLDEITETFIARMSASEEETQEIDTGFRNFKPGGKPGLGALCGVLIGAVAYMLVAGSTPPSVRRPAAPGGVVLAGARQINSTRPKRVMGADPVASRPERRIPRETQSVARRSRSRKARRIRVASRSLLSRGWRFYRAGNYRKASYFFNRVVHLSPGLFKGYFGLAISLFEQGRDEAALRVLEKASIARGGRAERLLMLGVVCQFLGREKMARSAYARYLRKKPSGPISRDVRSLLARERLPTLTFPDTED